MGSQVYDELMKFEGKPYFDKTASRALGKILDIAQMKEVYHLMSDPEFKKSAAVAIYRSILNVDSDDAELFRQQSGIEAKGS